MTNIKDKIKKLLSLATSPNENEARDALLKAKELMAKNKMTEDDFREEQKLMTITCDEVKWTTDSGNIWMTSLCQLLADNYCCSASWRTVKGSRTHTLVIAGLEDDAKVCSEVIKYAVGFVLGKIKIISRKNPKTADASAKSYAKGFVLGMEMAFEDQKEEHPEWGLVVVKPQEVQDYERGLGNRNVRTKKVDFDPLAYARGQKDGQEFNKVKALSAV